MSSQKKSSPPTLPTVTLQEARAKCLELAKRLRDVYQESCALAESIPRPPIEIERPMHEGEAPTSPECELIWTLECIQCDSDLMEKARYLEDAVTRSRIRAEQIRSEGGQS